MRRHEEKGGKNTDNPTREFKKQKKLERYSAGDGSNSVEAG